MLKYEDFKTGLQIRYTPTGETGFITSYTTKTVFCRFWSKSFIGTLRTTANSEGCNPRDLESLSQNIPSEIINSWLEWIKNEEKNAKIEL